MIGDATQIHQVVLNLCTNAAHAMKSGGVLEVRLDVARFDAPHTVLTGALAPGDYVRVCVQDSGTGIDPHLRNRIFDPFFTTKGVGFGHRSRALARAWDRYGSRARSSPRKS